MRVIPVLDILGGRAVHARAGDRASYAPLSSQLAPDAPGDALAIARAFADGLGFTELYLADLDAIMRRPPQRALRRAIAGARPAVAAWMDAGVASTDQARELVDDGAERVIIGLESLAPAPDPREALARLVRGIDPTNRAVFSLDLRAGQPDTADPVLRALPPLELAKIAASAGVATIIVLDLARVGTGAGVDLALVRAVRRALPGIELVAGGGVRDAAELRRLADAGVDAALVGSALHHGSATHRSGFWMRGVSPFDVTSPSDEL